MVETRQQSGALDFLHQLNEGFDQEAIDQSRRLVNHLFVLFRSATTR